MVQKTTSTKTIRAAVVGAGYVSSYHIRAIQSLPFAKVVAIADPDQEKARALAATFSIPNVCSSLDDLSPVNPDVVHILTPPALHCDLAVKAMRMGCHVLVEKPMADTVEECDRMLAVAAETGRVLTVNHSARMDPIVLRALEAVRSGAIGDILAVHFFRNSEYPPYAGGTLPAPYRRGAYPFEDLGVHGLYLIESFLGKVRDLDVRYRSSGRDPNLFFDEWTAELECERGPGHMYISWNSRPMQNELVIHGTKGVLSVDCYLQLMSMQKTMPLPKPIQRMVGTSLVALENLYRVPLNLFKFVSGKLKPNPGIHVSVRAFYNALAAGTEPPVPAEEGRRMIALLERTVKGADTAKIKALLPSPSAIPPRILVTGASGLLGSALLRRLQSQGAVVRLLLRRPNATLAADANLEVIYGDLGNPEIVDRAVRGSDLVYHVGAAMGGSRASFEAGTIHGTRNIVEACVRHGVKRLVYVSSVILLDYAGHKPGTPVDESWPLEPQASARGFYTQAKLEAEQIVINAMREHQLPAVVIRPGQIFGRGSEKFAPAGTIGLGGRWIVVGNGTLPLPLVYIEDVVDSLLIAAEKEGVCGSIFHIVDPNDVVTQNEYIDTCRKLNGKLKVTYVSPSVLMTVAWLAGVVSRITKVNLPLSPYRLRSSRPIGPFNCKAALAQLGWRPRVGARAGLERALQQSNLQQQQDGVAMIATTSGS